MSLPEKIRALRKERDWPQRLVASKLNISRSAIGKYETGKQEPKEEILHRYAELFNVPLSYFTDNTPIGETGEQKTAYRTSNGDLQTIQELLQKVPKLKQSLLNLDQYPLKEQQKAGEFLETFVSGLRKSR
ncbi:helix-turn-helix domain-containing protein [Peribacillus acanthi]|uniref:helix-turn-helix domain-containing protein n=1 Tax=Peribacillus acanthi TaxID=2171554 RepID=UPI00130049A2|nr:helix-turn-helix transcriptional regulator [Peribacillus acanthi]